MNLTPEQIEADKKLCEAATPGPWRQDHADDDGFGIEGFLERKQPDGRPDPQIVCEVWRHEPEGKHNAKFIARFNPKTVLGYIAEIKRLRGALEFYANPKIYDEVREVVPAMGGEKICVCTEADKDSGDIARAALAAQDPKPKTQEPS